MFILISLLSNFIKLRSVNVMVQGWCDISLLFDLGSHYILLLHLTNVFRYSTTWTPELEHNARFSLISLEAILKLCPLSDQLTVWLTDVECSWKSRKLFSCPGSSIPDLGQSVSHSLSATLEVLTKRVTFEPSDQENNDNKDNKDNDNEDNDKEDNDNEDNDNEDNDNKDNNNEDNKENEN